MAQNHSRSSRVAVGFEVAQSHLHLMTLTARDRAGQLHVRARSVPWRREALSLNTDRGREEFAAALASLAEEERLRGATARFSLTRACCTTRVLSGGKEQVRRELERLQARSELYLALGRGPKTLAIANHPLDARHDQAMVAVANRGTVEALLAAATRAGLVVDAIEPTMLALCRILGYRRLDADEPQLLANLTPEGLEIGVSWAGRLLLDYRPGGKTLDHNPAAVVAKHHTRLRRYCQRYCAQEGHPLGADSLTRVYLVGPAQAVEEAAAEFRAQDNLEGVPLLPDEVESSWHWGGETARGEISPALGTCLASLMPPDSKPGPNFLDRIRAERREPLWPGLARAAWPLAVAFLIAIVLSGLNLLENTRFDRLTQRLVELEPACARVGEYRRRLLAAEAKGNHLRRLLTEIESREWADTLADIGHCLPEGTWLNRLEIREGGTVFLTGTSYGDEAVYELSRWLADVPEFSAVQLEGMEPLRLPTGLATKFDIKFAFADHGELAKKAD